MYGHSGCPKGKFQCRTRFGHRCISETWKCDTKVDCVDGQDEENCTRCNPMLWECKDLKPPYYKCLDPSWRCDGHVDCDLGEDEHNCEPSKSSSTSTKSQDRLPYTGISSNSTTVTTIKPGQTMAQEKFVPDRLQHGSLMYSLPAVLLVLILIVAVFFWHRKRQGCKLQVSFKTKEKLTQIITESSPETHSALHTGMQQKLNHCPEQQDEHLLRQEIPVRENDSET